MLCRGGEQRGEKGRWQDYLARDYSRLVASFADGIQRGEISSRRNYFLLKVWKGEDMSTLVSRRNDTTTVALF